MPRWNPLLSGLVSPQRRAIRRIKTAKPATVRHVNRAIVLNLIRVNEPLCRADLSRQTGIVRSNISGIVDELIEEGLIIEKRAKPEGRGRVPIQLFLNDAGFRVIGVNLNPSTTSVAVAGLSGCLQTVVSFPTPEHPDAFVRELRKTIRGFGSSVQDLGLGVAGLVCSNSGDIVWMSARPQYSGFPMGSALARELNMTVSVENDCNLGALAEMWLGKTEVVGLDDFVFLEVGELGVGAGICHKRQLYQGQDASFAGEFGHMVIDPRGPLCHCGRPGCWRLYVSDQATLIRYTTASGRPNASLDDLLVSAERGEPLALGVLRETARYLSLGISNIMFALNPQKIVLAGRITQVWSLIQETVEQEFASPGIRIKITPARLEAEQLFLHGAVHLALGKVFTQPRLGW